LFESAAAAWAQERGGEQRIEISNAAHARFSGVCWCLCIVQLQRTNYTPHRLAKSSALTNQRLIPAAAAKPAACPAGMVLAGGGSPKDESLALMALE
jgi:hypothetical protein